MVSHIYASLPRHSLSDHPLWIYTYINILLIYIYICVNIFNIYMLHIYIAYIVYIIYIIYGCHHNGLVGHMICHHSYDHMTKFISWHKAMVVITVRARCFYDFIHILKSLFKRYGRVYYRRKQWWKLKRNVKHLH